MHWALLILAAWAVLLIALMSVWVSRELVAAVRFGAIGTRPFGGRKVFRSIEPGRFWTVFILRLGLLAALAGPLVLWLIETLAETRS